MLKHIFVHVVMLCYLIFSAGCVWQDHYKAGEYKPIVPIPPDGIEQVGPPAPGNPEGGIPKIEEFSSVGQFIKDSSGSIHAISKTVTLENGFPSTMTLRSLRLSPDDRILDSYPLGSAERISSFLHVGHYHYLFLAQTNSIDEGGSLFVDLRPTSVSFEGARPAIHESPSRRVLFKNPIYDVERDTFYDDAEAQVHRANLAGIFKNRSLVRFVDPILVPVEDAGGAQFAFIHNEVEAGLVSLQSGLLQTIKPFDLGLTQSARVILCDSDVKRISFVAIGSPDQLKPIRHLIEPSSIDSITGARFAVLFIERSPDGRLHLLQHVVYRNNDVADISRCIATDKMIYTAGWVWFRSKGRSRMFVAKAAPGVLDLGFFNLDNNVTPKALYQNPIDRSLLIGGDYGFSQAQSGSMSDASGFVLHLNETFSEIGRYYFKDRRTTAVTAVWMDADDQPSSKIFVGGYTDGPSTHSPDRSAKRFVVSFKPNERRDLR